MNITFTACGMSFDATVNYSAGCPAKISGPPESCHPAEAPEIEFESLTVDGNDAAFLLDSSISDRIEEAAMIAADAYLEDAAIDAAIERAESMRDEARCCL